MEKINSFKMHRLDQNPKEKVFLEKFLEEHAQGDSLSAIVFGTTDGINVTRHLENDEDRIVVSTIQWLGSPIGRSFLKDCGFVEQTVQ